MSRSKQFIKRLLKPARRSLSTPPGNNGMAVLGTGVAAEMEKICMAYKGHQTPVTQISKAARSWWADVNASVRMGQPLDALTPTMGQSFAQPKEPRLDGGIDDFAEVADFAAYQDSLSRYSEARLSDFRRIRRNATSISLGKTGDIAVGLPAEDNYPQQTLSFNHVVVATGPGAARQLDYQLLEGRPQHMLNYPQIMTGQDMLSGAYAHPRNTYPITVLGAGSTAAWVVEQLTNQGLETYWLNYPAGKKPSMLPGGRRNSCPNVTRLFGQMLEEHRLNKLVFSPTTPTITLHLTRANGESVVLKTAQVVAALGSVADSAGGALRLLDLQSFRKKGHTLVPVIDENNTLSPRSKDKKVLAYAIKTPHSRLEIVGAAAYTTHRHLLSLGLISDQLTFGAERSLPETLAVGPGIVNIAATLSALRKVPMYNNDRINFNTANFSNIVEFLSHNKPDWSEAFITSLATTLVKQRVKDTKRKHPFFHGLGLEPKNIAQLIQRLCKKYKQDCPEPNTLNQLANGHGLIAEETKAAPSSELTRMSRPF